MENALRYEMEKAIPALKGELYPTNAPETAKKAYLVYARLGADRIKTLEGYTNKQALSYMFSIMAPRHEEMKSLTDKVEGLLLSLAKKHIGKDKVVFVEDVSINNIEETYEFNLKKNRGIIDFTIYI